MHKTWPTATDVAHSMVCVLITWKCCVKMAKSITMPFGQLTRRST